jgi:hypothetical protein
VRALLLNLIATGHQHVLAQPPYAATSRRPAAIGQHLRACLDLLLFGTASPETPGLAPLLLCACQERGLGSATGSSGGSSGGSDGEASGGEYVEAKRACFGLLLGLVVATAGSDVGAWRAAAGDLEALCLAHGHLEGLFELAVQVISLGSVARPPPLCWAALALPRALSLAVVRAFTFLVSCVCM